MSHEVKAEEVTCRPSITHTVDQGRGCQDGGSLRAILDAGYQGP